MDGNGANSMPKTSRDWLSLGLPYAENQTSLENHIFSWMIFKAHARTIFQFAFFPYWMFHIFLVGGLEHDFFDVPFSWECHHPN